MKNAYKTEGDVTAIFIQCKGETHTCYIDTEDLEKVSAIRGSWNAVKDDYWDNIYVGTQAGYRTRIHRVIMDAPEGYVVDHINGNGLDNRKCNLRIVTAGDNCQNRSASKTSKSGIRGVHWCKTRKTWIAQYMANNRKYFKRFKTAEAAEAYVIEQRRKFQPYSSENVVVPEPPKPIHYSGSKSVIRGVHWMKRRNCWVAKAQIDYKDYYLGQFATKEEAELAMIAFRKKQLTM